PRCSRDLRDLHSFPTRRSSDLDKNVERVLLRVDGLQPSGYASLRELAAALARLRESGKQVIAFSEGMGQAQYLLAAQADEVYLEDRKSTRLNSSHVKISYAVFC